VVSEHRNPGEPPPLGDADVPPEDDTVEWNAPMTDDEVIELLGPGTYKDETGAWRKPPLEREPFDPGPNISGVGERGNGERARISPDFVGIDPELKARLREQLSRDDDDDDEDTIAVAPDGYRYTDKGNADRLVAICPGCFRHAHAWQRWLVYRRGVWAIDEGDVLITEQAKGVARALFRLLPTYDFDSDKRKKLFAWALRSESSGAIAAMVKLARGIPGVIVEHEQLDADPCQLNVLNGTVDLHTGELLPHDPADLITKQCPVVYDPDAKAPLWEKCLERWQPDPVMRDYIQLEAGAAATGKHTETLSVHYGTGGNGKSRCWGAIQRTLGPYAVVPHKSLLVTQRHEQHETIKADLFRARLALTAETKAADVLDDEQVKAITGGDRQRARRMREDPWFFDPSHTLIMFSNYRPRIQGRDEAIWRRLRLVPWDITIPDHERDRDLADKLALEVPGILRWIVAGARRFLADGFDPPDTVRQATAAYRADEDTAGRFVTEALHLGDGWAWSADIVDALGQWATDQGIDPPPDMREIAAILKAAGCTHKLRRRAGRRGVMWTGVTLETAVNDETETQ
jgi:putative DNA primase/helicase